MDKTVEEVFKDYGKARKFRKSHNNSLKSL